MDQRRRHRRKKKHGAGGKFYLKNALLLFLCVVTLAVPLLTTGGTAFSEPVTAQAAGGAYDDLALELVGATAFDDARRIASKGETSEGESDDAYQTFLNNLAILTDGTRWGNVGLFIAQKGTSQNSDIWSVFYSKVSVNKSQIDTFDDYTGNAFSKYKAFGAAVQNLNKDAKKAKGSSYALQEGVSAIQSAAGKLTNLGTNLLARYNPAPLVWAFYDYNEVFVNHTYGFSHAGFSLDKASADYNGMVAFVEGNDGVQGFFRAMGSPAIGNLSLFFVIVAFIIIILLLTAALLVLFNGRSAGENIRKAIVKLVIACVGAPLICSIFGWGLNFLQDTSMSLGSSVENKYVKQNLNLADWYACYFALPDGIELSIDDNGEFVLSPDAVYAINEFTYMKVTGSSTFDATDEMQRMEEQFNNSQSSSMQIAFSEPIRKRDGKPWKTANYYALMNNFGSNATDLTAGMDGDYEESGEDIDVANIGYLSSASLVMNEVTDVDGVAYKVIGNGEDYGMSPIAATNLMLTSFTGSGMSVSDNATIGPVVFNADNAELDDGADMNPIVELLATFAIIMAAIKGLFTIIAAGFGGIIGGSAKSAMGMSTGLGQAIGGVLALIGGVFGIGIIMTLSLTLLGQIYDVLYELIASGVGSSGTSLLDPIADVFVDIPFIGTTIARGVRSIGSLILMLLAIFTLPKFGGIPVTLFCQSLAELPHRFAVEAQQIENKFTGDFRAGGGGLGGGSAGGTAATMINQIGSEAGNRLGQMGSGLTTIAGAVGGYGLTKLGQKLEKSADKEHSSDSMASESDTETEAPEAQEGEALDGAPNPDAENPDAAPGEGGEPVADEEENPTPEAQGEGDAQGDKDPSKAGDSKTVLEGGNAENVEGDTLNGKEEEKQDTVNAEHTDHSEEDSDEETSSEMTGYDNEVGEESTMTEVAQQENNDGTQVTSSEIQAENDNVSSEQSLNEQDQVDQEHTTTDSVASLDSENDHVSEKQGSVMGDGGSDGEKQGTPGTASSGETGKTSAADAKTGAVKAGEASASQAKSMNSSGKTGSKSSSSKTSEKGRSVKAQGRARLARAAGRALQAAGGHTTGADALAGVAAGTLHTAGSITGAGKYTQRAVNGVREERARRMDAARGANPAARRRSVNQNQNRGTGANNRSVNSPGSRQGGAASPQQARQEAVRNAQIAQEENYRQREEAEAARRKPDDKK